MGGRQAEAWAMFRKVGTFGLGLSVIRGQDAISIMMMMTKIFHNWWLPLVAKKSGTMLWIIAGITITPCLWMGNQNITRTPTQEITWQTWSGLESNLTVLPVSLGNIRRKSVQFLNKVSRGISSSRAPFLMVSSKWMFCHQYIIH